MNNPPDVSPQPNQKISPFWSIGAAFVFFLVVWLMGWPSPAVDDLFYNGAALNMAGGGDFSNPLLDRQGFPSHYFFVYPPFHPYAVYAWLSVFGVSSSSLLGFHNLMFFVIAASTIVLIRREGAPEILSWLVPWGVLAIFLKPGLRPEILAVALTMSGYALLVYARKAGLYLWFSFFLLFIGIMTAPRTSFFGAVLALLVAWQWLKSSASNPVRFRFCIISGTALADAGLIFLALIGFRVTEFYHTFHLHSTRINAGALTLFARGVREFGVRWWPICFLAVLLLCLTIRFRAGEAAKVCVWLAATFLLAGLRGALGHGSTWYLVFIIFLLAAALAPKLSRCCSTALTIAIACVMIGANSSKLIEGYGILSGNIDCRPPENRAAILAMQSSADHPILIDSSTARYVYDYRLPRGVLDFCFAAPFPGFMAIDTKIRPEDTYILGPGKTSILNGEMHASYPIEYWSLFGSKNRTSFKHPCQAYVIPARDCLEATAKQPSQ